MDNLAPVCIFVFNRPRHTKITLDTLAGNKLASATNLFIFSDGPRNERDVESIKEVRNIIHNEDRFKSVEICSRDQNRGLAKSIIIGVTQTVSEFKKVIVLEDDLQSSPFFLSFMNKALDLYENDPKVVSISGYTFPMKGELPDTFFQRRISSWGWATWERGWQEFRADSSELIAELTQKHLENAFDLEGSYPFFQMLRDQEKGLNNSWAIRFLAAAYLKNLLTLYPGQSLIQNIGFDNTGVHCKPTREFEVVLAKSEPKLYPIEVVDNDEIHKRMKAFYKKNKRLDQRILRRIRNTANRA